MSEPAFPGFKAYVSNDQPGWQQGLSKRELLAAMAMQGLLADPEVGGGPEIIAKDCVRYADALLAELEKKP